MSGIRPSSLRLLPAWIALTLIVLEGLAILGPILALVRFDPETERRLLLVGVPTLLVVAAAHLLAWRALLGPFLLWRRDTEPNAPDDARRRAAYASLLRAPWRIVWLRTTALFACIAIPALLVHWFHPVPDLLLLLSIAALHGFAVSLVRGLLYGRAVRRLAPGLVPDRDRFTFFRATLMDRILEVELVTGAGAVAGIALFIYFFVDIPFESYKALEAAYAPAVTLLLALWYALLRRLPRSLLQFLDQPNDTKAELAYRHAQRLPIDLALVRLGGWTAAGIVLAIEAHLLGVDTANAALMLATVAIATVGGTLLALLWHRTHLRPLVASIAERYPSPTQGVRARIGVRGKLFAGVAALVLFAFGLSLLWTLLQYRAFTAAIVARDAEIALLRLQSDPASRTLGNASDAIAYLARRGDPTLTFAPPGTAPAGIPKLDLTRADGTTIGSVLAHPSAQLPWRGQLAAALGFVVVIAALSIILVLFLVRDLIGPIARLERRVISMERGKLDEPFPPPEDADEIGLLAVAFERMRRSVLEKVRDTEAQSALLEKEVARRTQALVQSEKLASMGRLVAGIAHEINNPVSALVNTLEPLEETLSEQMHGALPPEVKQMLGILQRGAKRTKEIVSALHGYARGDAEQRVTVDLHRRIDESLELLRHHIKQGIEVEKVYGEVAAVQGYPGQLQQVFMNLITNAAQALSSTPEKGDKRIRIATSRRGQEVLVEITDNGPGIPPELLPRIFDPFFTTKDVGEGSGLGLSIVHGIVERHGGRIEVDSTVGRGTTFRVILPAPPVDV